MTTIDPLVFRQLESSGGKAVPVLIVCDTSCASVISALERAGITVTSTGSAEMGSIGASITSAQLERLESIPGIIAVELDQEAGIFGSD